MDTLFLILGLGRKSLISKKWRCVPEMQRLAIAKEGVVVAPGGVNFLETPFYDLFSSKCTYPFRYFKTTGLGQRLGEE